MKLIHLRAFAFAAFGLVVLLGLTRAGDPPRTLIDAIPAASTHCVKPELACDASCVRLIAKRSLT